MVTKAEIVTLHKYYLNASRMRSDFIRVSNLQAEGPDVFDPDQITYMSLWYGCLRVVIEGWHELKLSDEEVDKILTSEKVLLLNGFRNDLFHFQREYVARRSLAALKDPGFALWITQLHLSLGRTISSLVNDNPSNKNS